MPITVHSYEMRDGVELCKHCGEVRDRNRVLPQLCIRKPNFGGQQVEVAKLRSALVRLLWDSVADDAPCTCDAGVPVADICPQCEAMQALGFERWIGAEDAERKLQAEMPMTSPYRQG